MNIDNSNISFRKIYQPYALSFIVLPVSVIISRQGSKERFSRFHQIRILCPFWHDVKAVICASPLHQPETDNHVRRTSNCAHMYPPRKSFLTSKLWHARQSKSSHKWSTWLISWRHNRRIMVTDWRCALRKTSVTSAGVTVTFEIQIRHHLSHITRKPVFGVCDQVRLKPDCSATEAS